MSLAMDLRLRERALSQWSDHRTYRTYVYVRTYPTVSTISSERGENQEEKDSEEAGTGEQGQQQQLQAQQELQAQQQLQAQQELRAQQELQAQQQLQAQLAGPATAPDSAGPATTSGGRKHGHRPSERGAGSDTTTPDSPQHADAARRVDK